MTESIRFDEHSGLRYYEAGTGADLLFLHGFGSSPEGYKPLLEALSQHYHVVAPFLYSKGVQGIPDAVERIEQLLSNLGASGPYLMACYSNGSFSATQFTARNAARISRLILLAAMVRPGRLLFIDRGILLMLTLCRHVIVRGERRHILRLMSVFTRNVFTNPTGMIAQLRDAYKMDIISTIRKTAVPVQIISGTKDTVVPPAQGYMLHDSLPSSTLTLLDGDHLMGIVTPEPIVREIRGRENGEGKV